MGDPRQITEHGAAPVPKKFGTGAETLFLGEKSGSRRLIFAIHRYIILMQ